MSMSFRITYSVLDADMAEIDRQFDAALHSVKAGLGATFPSWVAGKPLESGDLLESRAPADTRVLLANFHRASPAVLDRAVKAAQEAQIVWCGITWKDRVKIIRHAAELISQRRLPLAAIMSMEVGKSRLESLGDIEESADLLRYYAGQVEEAHGFVKPLGKLSPNEDTRSVLKPYGVFAVISPFNFPTALAAGMSSAALVAGNAVILKPSEDTPWCAEGLYHCFADAGLPEGLFQVLHGTGEVIGQALVRHPGIDGVAFTGSAKVGMEIHQVMSSTGRARPALLELGGKNPAIVCDDADLAAAVEGCARSAFGLSGQKCSALSRIYVQHGVKDEFISRLVARAAEIKIGDPTRADVYMGPVINQAAVQRYERAAAEARRDGHVLAGGMRLGEGEFAHGHFVAPTIVSVPRGHRIVREELFLPFVTVEPFETIEEAVALANDVEYGLTAGIFAKDPARIDYFMNHMQAGVLYANRKSGATTGAWPGVQAFCGWKASGSTGKGGCGPYYVAQFAREQSQTRML
jgi:1-pyrroline-5-carboxylate dehydrogenase